MIDGDQVDEPTPEGVDAPIVSKGSKFETFFDAPYNEIKGVLKDAVLPGQRVLDLGANKGNLEDFLDTLDSPLDVECVDTDEEALEELRVKKFENLAVGIVLADANEFIEGYTGDAIDVVLINATLHEINTPDNQREYLRHFFERMAAILTPEGKIIIGDYYYPDSVTDDEVARFMEYQLKAINHADTRNKFVKPDLLCEVGQESGFSVDQSNEIKAVKEIDRRFYVVVLKKQK